MRSTIATRIAIAVRPNSGDWLEPEVLADTTLDWADAVIGFRRTELELD